MKIVTVTLSPAIDAHAECDRVLPYTENLLTIKSRNYGGKGINVSRALSVVGVDNTAVILLPRNNVEKFEADLKKDGINYLPFYTSGSVRENITVHTLVDGARKETRLSFAGETVSKETLEEVINKIEETVEDNSLLAFCGSLPSGLLPYSLLEPFEKLQSRGVKIILDSKSFSLEDIGFIKPYLIKPNAEECKKYIGAEPKDFTEAASAAKKLAEMTGSGVLLSLGEVGATLALKGVIYEACAPQISPISTIGAGDSMIAGFIKGLSCSLPYDECLRYAVAFGSAKCLEEGTLPPRKSNIDALLNKVNIKTINI